MLFYIKKSILLEFSALIVLCVVGLAGMEPKPERFLFDRQALLWGVGGFLFLSFWTLGVQLGYRMVRGKEFARSLTDSLARQFQNATLLQVLLGGCTAAFGEEIFFRGMIQENFGIAAGAVAFGLGHWGGKEIRTVSLWAFAQGFWLGALFHCSDRLTSAMMAHGFFDIGGFIYFRWILPRLPE